VYVPSYGEYTKLAALCRAGNEFNLYECTPTWIQYVTPAARRIDHRRPAEPSPRKYLHLYTNCDRRVVLPLKSTILLCMNHGLQSHAYKQRKPQVRHSCDMYIHIHRVRKQRATLLLQSPAYRSSDSGRLLYFGRVFFFFKFPTTDFSTSLGRFSQNFATRRGVS